MAKKRPNELNLDQPCNSKGFIKFPIFLENLQNFWPKNSHLARITTGITVEILWKKDFSQSDSKIISVVISVVTALDSPFFQCFS